MRRRALQAVAASLLALGLAPAPFVYGQVPTQAVRDIVIETVPPVSGLRLDVSTGSYRTDHKGNAHLNVEILRRFPAQNRDAYRTLPDGGIFKSPRVNDLRLPNTGVAALERFYGGGQIALTTSYLFRPDFRGPNGERVDPSIVQSYRLKSRTGEVIEVKGSKPVRLLATRVVPYSGELVSKEVEWSLERVLVDGANVVNRAQNRFSPRRLQGRPYPVKMLFYPVRVTSTDAIFGFHLGKDIVLTYPSGLKRNVPFKDPEIVMPALPRGTYTVKVNAPGISPARPVAVSRAQVVELKVISWLDLALAGVVLAAIAIGLLVARRPHLRRLRRRPSPTHLRDELVKETDPPMQVADDVIEQSG